MRGTVSLDCTPPLLHVQLNEVPEARITLHFHTTLLNDSDSLQLLRAGEYVPVADVHVLEAAEQLKVLQRSIVLEEAEEEGV